MSINFIPHRGQMSKEVELCIVLKRLDILLSFCNSCLSHRFEGKTSFTCQTCSVRSAIDQISMPREPRRRQQRLPVPA